MATKPKKAKRTKKAAQPKKRPAAKKPPTGKPRYRCEACGVMITVTEEGLGVHRLMCCGQPMKRA